MTSFQVVVESFRAACYNAHMKKMLSLNFIVFLAAFLLFQIELIISKIFLPKFGGSYLVWGACVVFFQGVLLLGYLYSHFITQKFGIARYRIYHLVLLFVPLFLFPGKALPNIYAHNQIPLAIDISWQLIQAIGLVFFVLSTTSIIFQSWLAQSELSQRENPYTLYAVSNLGSFAALLTYPFLFEAFLDIGTQLLIWRLGYLLLVAVHLLAFKLVKVTKSEASVKETASPVGLREKMRWLLLGAGGVIMFLSVTNIITYEIAPIPLLWIIPLCIYLVSFVFNFQKTPWCPSWVRDKFYVTAGFSIILFVFTQKRILPFMIAMLGYFISLFIICMFCQNELSSRRPRDSKNLTLFYLMISFGGFLGGMLVSWVIPLISTIMVEYLAGLLVIALALIIAEKNQPIGDYNMRLIMYVLISIIFWPVLFKDYNIFGVSLLVLVFNFVFSEFRKNSRAFFLSIFAILCLIFIIEPLWDSQAYLYKHRNYYGIYKIYELKGKRFIVHGTTLHGAEYIAKDKEKEPLTYYHRNTPIGGIMTEKFFDFHNIALIGLGAGTLAAYTKANQALDFFELDYDIFRIAEKYFSFLKTSASKINFIFGDARLSLNKMSEKRYDILVVDAFSGDSIPVHLLTTEAIAEYRKHLADNGIVVFHVSNRYLNLIPVLFSNSQQVGAFFCYKSNRKSANSDALASNWAVLTWNLKNFQKLVSKLKWEKVNPSERVRKLRPWTDEYSNVFSVVRLGHLSSSIKEFQPFYW